MSRLDQMSEAELQAAITELQRSCQELRARQLVGSKSFRTYKITSPNAKDIILTNQTPGTTRIIDVTYTPLSTDLSSSPRVFSFFRTWNWTSTGVTNDSVYTLPVPRRHNAGTQTWRVCVLFRGTSGIFNTFDIKFDIYAIADGQLSFTIVQ